VYVASAVRGRCWVVDWK